MIYTYHMGENRMFEAPFLTNKLETLISCPLHILFIKLSPCTENWELSKEATYVNKLT